MFFLLKLLPRQILLESLAPSLVQSQYLLGQVVEQSSQEHRLWRQPAWLRLLASPPAHSVTSGKLLYIIRPQSPHLWMGITMSLNFLELSWCCKKSLPLEGFGLCSVSHVFVIKKGCYDLKKSASFYSRANPLWVVTFTNDVVWSPWVPRRSPSMWRGGEADSVGHLSLLSPLTSQRGLLLFAMYWDLALDSFWAETCLLKKLKNQPNAILFMHRVLYLRMSKLVLLL